MKVGIFQGGFKPFTVGHHSKLSLALQENDKVVLFYGIAARTKGSDFKYTKEMATQIYEIVKSALQREYAGKIIIEKPFPTPIVATFSFIGAIKDGEDKERSPVSKWGINPANVEKITIYGDPESLQQFTTNVIGKKMRTGEDKEERYYGDLVKTGRLVFDDALTDDGGLDRMAQSMIACGYKNDEALEDKINVRGSQIRAMAQACDWRTFQNFLPNFLNSKEMQQVIDIMQQGIQKNIASENLIRSYIYEVTKW
jgi:hypothetical protein